MRLGLIDAPNLVEVGAMMSIPPTNHCFGLINSKVLVHLELGTITHMYALVVLDFPLNHTGNIGYSKIPMTCFAVSDHSIMCWQY